MKSSIIYKVNNFSGNVSCSGVFNDNYIISKVYNNTIMKENVIPLDVYSSIKEVITQMFMRNKYQEQIFLWSFNVNDEPTSQRCYKITREEYELYKDSFVKHISYDGV